MKHNKAKELLLNESSLETNKNLSRFSSIGHALTGSGLAPEENSPRINPDWETGQATLKIQFSMKANPVPATLQETLDPRILRPDS
jgi:hypothetical protein